VTGTGAGASGILIVVGRDQAELYEYFRWGLGQTPGVEVVMDRRLGERRDRRESNGPPDDRRRSDRRRVASARAELLARGFLIARRDPRAGARDWGTLR
jgi:hypothetical protein